MKLLLEAGIRGCDGSLAVESFDILHEYASGFDVSERLSRFASARFRNEPS